MSEENERYVPSNNLDLNWLTIETVWGDSGQMPEYFKEMCEKDLPVKDKEGNIMFNEAGQMFVTKQNLWNMLKFFTRDFRLSNLGSKDLVFCEYYSNLAGDFLSVGFTKPFFTSLSRVVARLELCQSKSGFFRKQNNTLINERVNRDGNARKGLFSKKGVEE